jgi:hypothetical protein
LTKDELLSRIADLYNYVNAARNSELQNAKDSLKSIDYAIGRLYDEIDKEIEVTP